LSTRWRDERMRGWEREREKKINKEKERYYLYQEIFIV
jgi:hypothetical protein